MLKIDFFKNHALNMSKYFEKKLQKFFKNSQIFFDRIFSKNNLGDRLSFNSEVYGTDANFKF